jgi:uncharacterized membrane protein YbhN (UPF0104 family)
MPATYRKYLEFSALLLLAAAIIWWFGRKLDWTLVKSALAASDWKLISLAALVILGGYLWRAIRWKALLAPITKASLREIWIATTVGYGAVLTLGRAGEVVRPLVLPMRDERVRPAASFATIFVERIYDSLTVLLLFAISLVWFAPSTATSSEFAKARIVGFGFVGVLLVALALLIWFRFRSTAVITWIERRFNLKSSFGKRINRVRLVCLSNSPLRYECWRTAESSQSPSAGP